VVSRIQRAMGLDLHRIDVFRHQTIAGLAEAARKKGNGNSIAVSSAERIESATEEIAPITAEELELLGM
jgi:hypothetical protein